MSTFTLTTKTAQIGFVRSLKAKLWCFLAWVRPTTGGCLKGVWRVSGRSLKRVWKVSGKPGLDRFSPVCPGRYWVVSECCLYIMGGVWKVHLRIGTANFPLVVMVVITD